MVRRNPRRCITCKIRKVKCDEGWPACKRCVSTGRTCDGYGVWGGGGRITERDGIIIPSSARKIEMQVPDSGSAPPALPQQLSLAIVPRTSSEEQGYFEWFRKRSVLKLPGVFGSSFWDTLALQASANDPAVMHAVMALGAVHKRDVQVTNRSRIVDVHDEREQFILRQYSKAINCLQPHLSIHNKDSLRIALISCLVFVSLEFLRGHYRTGKTHLQNGLKLLDKRSTSILWPSYDAIDQIIMETFVRLQLQVQMFGQTIVNGYSVNESLNITFPAPYFLNLAQARQHLEYSLNEIFQLGQLRRHSAVCQKDPPSHELIQAQLRIRVELKAWLKVFLASFSSGNASVNDNTNAAFSYRFLTLYHTMADVMVETCLETEKESIFDNFTNNFVFILAQAIDISEALSTSSLDDGTSHSEVGSIADIGWIPPLYYTALKCRKHRVRLHAIRILSSTVHREGIWDSRLAGFVAQHVMNVEEGDFYNGLSLNEFQIHDRPLAEELLLPNPPKSHLVKDVDVILSDDNTEKVELMYKQRDRIGEWQVISTELDIRKVN